MIDTNAFVFPMPMVLVGALVKEKPNFIAVAWVSRVNYQPPMIAVALGKTHYTNLGIQENRMFSINIPTRDQIMETDFCGLKSGKQIDKSRIFDVFYGKLKKAPLAEQCALCMECTLVNALDLPSNTLFIGEIIAAYSQKKYLTDGNPDIKKISPFTLTMPDNHYWDVGEKIGKAWDIGRTYTQKIKDS